MKFTLTINCDNDAFMGSSCNIEVAAILHRVAQRVIEGDFDLGTTWRTFNQTLFDSDGNDVGRATYKWEEIEE